MLQMRELGQGQGGFSICHILPPHLQDLRLNPVSLLVYRNTEPASRRLLCGCLNIAVVQDRWTFALLQDGAASSEPSEASRTWGSDAGSEGACGRLCTCLWLVRLASSDSAEQSIHYGWLCCASHGRTGLFTHNISIRAQFWCTHREELPGLPEPPPGALVRGRLHLSEYVIHRELSPRHTEAPTRG